MLGAVFVDKSTPDKSSARHFVPTKGLCEKDCIIVDMLNSQGHESVAYCVCDPALADNPIVFASDGFCSLTGYEYDDIQGRNCRFLQGPQTNKEQVDRIRNSIQKQTEQSVNLLNYRKDGSTFVNEFFLTPLRDEQNNVQYVSETLWRDYYHSSTCIEANKSFVLYHTKVPRSAMSSGATRAGSSPFQSRVRDNILNISTTLVFLKKIDPNIY